MGKLQRVSNSKYRVVVSDVLPYERPVFFTNRFFARFLKHYGIVAREGGLVATRNADTEGLNEFLAVMGGKGKRSRPCFQYNITKEGREEGRRLTVIHPYHQVEMVEFYDRYKMLFIDFSRRSHFSIRYPAKVATCQKRQKGYHKLLSDDALPVDSSESLKHFFTYRHYQNINKFYGDFRFLRAEKRFCRMAKFDIHHCFESISPEMLSIAMFGHPVEECKGSMAYDFCQLQHSFMNRDNGIVIGPEFSRIYAEIVLQRIDMDVENDLEQIGIYRNSDYIFYRYVDDGFLYFDVKEVKEQFTASYIKRLKEFNLRLNDKKNVCFENRPFLEDISSTKTQLIKLVDVKFQNRLDTFKGFVKMQKNMIDMPVRIDFRGFVNEMRSIMRSEGKQTDYKDITSFLLGLIHKRMMSLLAVFNSLYSEYARASENGYINELGTKTKERYEREFISFCLEIIEILFFILCCDMRMSTSIKVVSLVNKLQMFVRGRYDIDDYVKSAKFPSALAEQVDDKISDELASLLINTRPCSYNLMETLNVLELEKVMKKKNQIMPSVLLGFLSKIEPLAENLNFLTVFELMHFIKDDSRYGTLQETLTEWIDGKIKSLSESETSDTESVLTFMEAMSCPWVDIADKRKYAKILFGDRDFEKVCRFAEKQKDLFVQWRDFNLIEAMLHINSSDVY